MSEAKHHLDQAAFAIWRAAADMREGRKATPEVKQAIKELKRLIEAEKESEP